MKEHIFPITQKPNERKINLLNCGAIKSYNSVDSYTSKRIPKVVEKAIWQTIANNSKEQSKSKNAGIEIA